MKLTASPRQGKAAGIYFFSPTDEKYLVLRRSADSDFPGTWCGAGGGIEAGETPREAAIREAFEELNFTDNANLVPLYKETEPGFVLYLYLGIVDKMFAPTLNDEHTSWEWLSLDEKPSEGEFHPGTVRFLQFLDNPEKALAE